MLDIPTSYWLTNLQFIIGILSFFSFFTTASLYMDSFLAVRKSPLLLIRGIGFFILAVWAGLSGALGVAEGASEHLVLVLQLVALLVIAWTFFIENLPGRPKESKKGSRKILALLPFPMSFMWYFLAPLLALYLAGRIWYQVTVKLERSRKLMALAMLLLGVSWACAALINTPMGQEGSLSVLAQPFGILWVVTLLFEALGSFALLLWAWNFLRFRLFPQLYLTVVAAVLIAFVATTMLLTVALITNAQQESLRVLSTNVRVFAFTLEELKQKMTLVANTIGSRPALIDSVEENDLLKTGVAIANPIREFGVSGVTVLNAGGEVVYTLGTDLQLGASLSADPVVLQAFAGASRATPYAQVGPEFPVMLVRSGAPMIQDGRVVGIVIVDFPVDTVFLDRVKELTGLEIILFDGTKLSATTLRDESGRPRTASGEEEFVQNILQAENGYRGSATLGHERFLVAGLPVESITQERIGALVVGISESELLRSLDEATQRTLLGAALLIVLSLLPLYGVAHVIARYQHS